MQRLNKGQIEYAAGRINGASREKKAVIEKKLTTGTPLTNKRRADLIRQGKVKLSKGITEITNYTDVTDAFDFSKFDEKLDSKKYNAECKKIDNEMAALMDELILGDTEQAFKIIKAL